MGIRGRRIACCLGGALLVCATLARAAEDADSSQAPPECRRSQFVASVRAEGMEEVVAAQYRRMLADAEAARALAPGGHPQLQRLVYIAMRLMPFVVACNARAATWKWEFNLIGSRQINAFSLPGGKLAVYFGALSELQLSDDELAILLGHEVAHVLLEHARENLGKAAASAEALRQGARLLGLDSPADPDVRRLAGGLLSLKFSRDDESEADALGLVLAAQAGYDPRAAHALWQKMSAVGSDAGEPPAFLSTHPGGPQRVKDIDVRLPRALPLFDAAAKPDQRFSPPARLPPPQAPQRR